MRCLSSRWWWRSIPTMLSALCLLAAIGWCAPARAACSSQGCVTAGPRLASIDSSQGELLNLITGSLLGSSVNLTVADWNALAGGNLKLVSLLQALQLQLGVSSPSTALSANATVAQILSAAATAAQADGQTLAASALGKSAAQAGPLGGVVRLGDLLDIRLPDNALATASIDALELLSGTAQLYNTRNVLTTPTPVGIPGVTLGLLGLTAGTVQLYAQAVEPPVYVCGPAGSQFHTATIRLKLNIGLASLSLDSSVLNGLGGILGADLQLTQLQLFIEVARAEGMIGLVNALGTALTVEATPGVVDLYLGSMPDNVFFERSRTIVPADVGYGTVAGLTTTILFNTQTVAVQARARARGQNPGVRSLSFPGPFPQTRAASTSLGFVATLLSDLIGNLELQIQPSLGPLVDGLLLDPLKGLIGGVVSPLLSSVLTGVGDPLLQALGVRLGEVDVTVGGAARLCDLAGHVYDDANHNATRDGGEAGCGQLLYAKVLSPSAPAGPALAVAPVHATTGAYAFGPVAAGTYQVVVNGSSAAADVAPAAPAGWLGTEVPTLSRAVTLATDVPPLNFGLFRGSSVSGSVFADTGAGGGTANDGVQQGAEAALANVNVRALSAGNAVLDSSITWSNGTFTVWVPASADGSVVRIVETDPGGHVSVAGQAGTLAAAGGVYDRAQDSIGFTPVAGTRYTGVVFADVPDNRLTGQGQQAVLAGATATHAHRFTAGSAGQPGAGLARRAVPRRQLQRRARRG